MTGATKARADIKPWIALAAALLVATHAHAQSDTASGRVFLPSCLAAVDIVQGKRPAADSVDAAKQLRQAAICFGAVTAVMNFEPLFKDGVIGRQLVDS